MADGKAADVFSEINQPDPRPLSGWITSVIFSNASTHFKKLEKDILVLELTSIQR